MSNQLCLCNTGIGNFGLPNCVKTQKAIRKSIFVQLQSNAGVLTSIDPSSTLDKAWITALINNADKSLRYFPTPEMKNVTTDKSDPTFEKWNDDSSFFIREGVRTFVGIFADCPAMFKSNLESLRCNTNVGKFDIDLEGNINGLTNNSDGKLYPIPVNVQSVVGKVVNGDDKATQQIMFSYEIPTWVNDGDFRMISNAAFPDWNPLQISGLANVNVTLVSVTDTVLTIKLTTPSPDLYSPIAVQGLLTANFVSASDGTTSKIWNVTDSANDTVVAAESLTIPGQYTLTYSSIAAKTLMLFAKLNGYDFSALKSLAIVTP